MSSEERARPLRRPLRASSSIPTPSARTTATAVKRDSLAAELERDPQFSTSKRQHRTQLFTNSICHASLERQVLQAQTARIELEAKLGERELAVQRLERDSWHYADREREEREAHEQLQADFDADHVRQLCRVPNRRDKSMRGYQYRQWKVYPGGVGGCALDLGHNSGQLACQL